MGRLQLCGSLNGRPEHFLFLSQMITRLPSGAMLDPALEGAAPERAQTAQAVGLNIYLPAAVILIMKQVHQFRGGVAVKISLRAYMQIAVVFFKE